MKHSGKVKDGVIVLDAPSSLEEGAIMAVERMQYPESQAKITRERVLRAIDASPLQFTKSWDEVKKETR